MVIKLSPKLTIECGLLQNMRLTGGLRVLASYLVIYAGI